MSTVRGESMPLQGDTISTAAATETPNAQRARRQQVSKACDNCRVRRVKCDDQRPCRSCQLRGERCVVRGGSEPRTLAQALREIERLKRKVDELESEVESGRSGISGMSGTSAAALTPATSSSGQSAEMTPWEGIFVATASSEQTSYYGPSSASYFISRIGAYLAKALGQPLTARHMQLRGVNRTLTHPTKDADGDRLSVEASEGRTPAQSERPLGGPRMSRTMEEYFLGVFWESYHIMCPIVDEEAFRQNYAALWAEGGPTRKPSALVDIVLALSIQYGYTLIPGGSTADEASGRPDRDATIAGRWYYRRCQSLLTADLESPSLTTVQCLVLSTTYLCCASFQNMAHIQMAVAVRNAQIVGLHLEPPSSLPRTERELRKRVWWVLCTIEAKTSTKQGRPMSVDLAQPTTTVSLPSDAADAGRLHGSATHGVRPSEGITWLTYSQQCQRLLQAHAAIDGATWPQYGRVLAATGQVGSPYKSPEALERCAVVLAQQLPRLEAWRAQVPRGLMTPRKGGRPFSLDTGALEAGSLDFEAPTADGPAPRWLRRQRVCLEMLYHNTALHLCRPFVSFCASVPPTFTPTAEAHATACARHAVALVALMHQTVAETDLLAGWHEFFLWHWNATVTLVGCLLAYPVHVTSTAVRAALDQSIAVCDVYGRYFAVAASAAAIARDLVARADMLTARLRSEVLGTTEATVPVDESTLPVLTGLDDLSWLDPSQVDGEQPEDLGEFMDWALTVDGWNSFERFYGTDSDMW